MSNPKIQFLEDLNIAVNIAKTLEETLRFEHDRTDNALSVATTLHSDLNEALEEYREYGSSRGITMANCALGLATNGVPLAREIYDTVQEIKTILRFI
jgi:hypothetical protein